MARPRRNGAAGFTLVEVLVSMLLVAIVLPVAMQGVSMALQLASLARQRSLAVSLAETELDDLITTAAWDQSSMKGDFPDYPDYHWTAEVTEWESTTVQQVEVSVQWTSRGQERAVTLDTLVYTGTGTQNATTSTGARSAGPGGRGQ